MSWLGSFLFVLCLQLTFSAEETYKAAVVEFGVSYQGDVIQMFNSNTQRYLDLIQKAAQMNVDILVFPESTLNYAFTSDRARVLQYAMYLPDPEDLISPCDQDNSNSILKAISCAAKDGHLYIVINVSEKLRCEEQTQAELRDARPCHPDRHYLFNSNLVFDRYGAVVSRYRKTHLFGELAFNTTAHPELDTFTTDFGVEFGHLICFDLQYDLPAQELLRRGVRNFVLPLMWYSELPFLTAVQYEEAWAYASEANLLAAGASSPLSGSGGSGVFSGRAGARVAIMSGETTTRLLVAEVHKRPDLEYSPNNSTEMISENPRRMNLLRDHLDLFALQFLEPETLNGNTFEEICYGEFCCSFNITASLLDQPTTLSYEYALVAFRGVRTFSGVASGGVENCGLVACTSRERDSCGLRFSQSTEYSPFVVFEEITLSGDFTLDHAAQYPTGLTGDMLPLTTDQFTFDSTTIDNASSLTVKLTARQHDLLTFGVFGRVFSMDSDPVTEDNAESLRLKVLDIDRARIINEDGNLDYSNSSGSDLFEYIWTRLGIVLVILGIYVLEMI